MVKKLIIIGSGPAGLTAAIYAARASLDPVVIAGAVWGGQLMITTDVENYPGFPKGVQGPELMELMKEQAERFGTKMIYEDVGSVDLSSKPYRVAVGDQILEAETIILASGASAKWLGLPSEERFIGKGVSACATCDGFFFKEKDVVVVGGGDTAIEEATFLIKFASTVTIIHRRNKLRASKIMQQRAIDSPKIKFIWDSVIEEVLGEEKVRGVIIKNLKTGGKLTLKCEGVFIAIGHRPSTEIFTGLLDMDERGYIIPRNYSHTNVDGVFVAGDVHDTRYRQAVTAAAAGCQAAIDAEKYLEGIHS